MDTKKTQFKMLELNIVLHVCIRPVENDITALKTTTTNPSLTMLWTRVGGMSRQAFECAAAGQCFCLPILGVTDHSLSSAGAESTVVASPCLIAMSQRPSVQ